VRNYEIDRTLTHTRQAPGRISRVTAAVLVDNLPGAPGKDGKPTERALNAQEIQRIQSLVQQAIGFDAQRGDAVTVVNSPFATPARSGEWSRCRCGKIRRPATCCAPCSAAWRCWRWCGSCCAPPSAR